MSTPLPANGSEARRPYFAFASGALSYDCAPCGRCCHGLGWADEVVHLGNSPTLSSVLPFVASSRSAALVDIYTYSDGCRFVGDDNLCDIHKNNGPAAKPAICRLFPFSQLVEVDGLHVLLPQASCPWQAAASDAIDPLSQHEAITAQLAALADVTLAGRVWTTTEQLPVATRRAVEERIRDASAQACDSYAQALETSCALQLQAGIATAPLWQNIDLWLDLLRAAGEPPPLPPQDDRLLRAALPTLRIYLAPHLPMAQWPAALQAFELWLRALAELPEHRLSGENILHLLRHIMPVLVLLVYADRPAPTLPQSALTSPLMQTVGAQLAARPQTPLGEVVLDLLRPFHTGAVGLLAHIAEATATTLATA